jgi:aromatic-amino-acid transaminase
MFESLEPKPDDPLLALIAQFRSDDRPHKIDLGVGVYRDERGRTPVFRAVKAAERILAETQDTKSYLGVEGNAQFLEQLLRLALVPEPAGAGDWACVQTPGGTGALRLAAELVRAAEPDARIVVGLPTWPNYEPLFTGAGLRTTFYRAFDAAAQRVLFAQTIEALNRAKPGDVVLLQASCQNPTGTDFDLAQMIELARVLRTRRLLPLIDVAYQGLGRGWSDDVQAIRVLLCEVEEAMIAYSCDKNFGLYRERTGALFVRARDGGQASAVRSRLRALARGNWSMPPDHGAAIVSTILSSAELTRNWRNELDVMRQRLRDVRSRLAGFGGAFAALQGQDGLFSLLPVPGGCVEELRTKHAVYLAPSGRANIAGLNDENIERFVAACRECGVR